MSATNTQSLTVRLQPELYTAATHLARKRSLSLNALVQQSLAAWIKSEEDRELYEAFEELGKDKEACDVEYAFAAQSEVVLSDKY